MTKLTPPPLSRPTPREAAEAAQEGPSRLHLALPQSRPASSPASSPGPRTPDPREDRPADPDAEGPEEDDDGTEDPGTEGTPDQPLTRRERRASRLAAKAAEKAAEKTERPAQRAVRQPTQVVVRPLAARAVTRRRHWGLLLSFVLVVLLPAGAASLYLWTRAVDQYASTLGFTVRSEDVSSAVDILGGLGSTLGASSGARDSDILYEFVRSQEVVAKLDSDLDLRGLYSRHYDEDPLFSFDPDGTIEDLTDYWGRMLRISYDSSSGLMELRVLAFDPEEARAVATALYDESSAMINELSAIARADATRYAAEDLDRAVERLKEAREALTAFRVQSQIVDPAADIQGQMGLLNTLQAQLAEALIDLDLLTGNTGETDPRMSQAQRRIDVIQARIAEERQKFGSGQPQAGGENYASIIADFERLSVDREFAETAYTAALSAYDAARAEANRQSRYLAAYIRPTLAQSAEYPQRQLILGLVALFGFLIWAIGSLVYYSLRDRK